MNDEHPDAPERLTWPGLLWLWALAMLVRLR